MCSRLAALRKARDMTQATLAMAMEVSETTIWRWERRFKGITHAHLMRLARVLRAKPTDIFPDYSTVPDAADREGGSRTVQHTP